MKTSLYVALSVVAGGISAGSAFAGPVEDAAPRPLSLTGNTSFDGFNRLTAAANPGFPGFPGSGAWPRPIESNVAGSGDATLNKIASGSGGGPYPGSLGLYYGGFSGDVNTNGGTLSAADATPVANVKTVVFQLEIGEAWTYDFFNRALPTLSYNGGSQALAANFSEKLVQAYNGTVTMPTGEEPVYINLWALQWDLSTIGTPITSLDVRWNGVQHGQVYALQLDQSDAAYNYASWGTQPVPEPASIAALSLGALALLKRRRK